MKYSYYKTEDGRFFITHKEGETNTWIAMTSDAEKADFLTKAANSFSEGWEEHSARVFDEGERYGRQQQFTTMNTLREALEAFVKDYENWKIGQGTNPAEVYRLATEALAKEDEGKEFWTEEMILRYAELYRWSSGRITMKGFLEDTNGWQKVDIKEAREFQVQEDTGKAYKGQENKILIKVEFKDHDKVVLTNESGDTYTSKSEELMDFLHGQSVPPYKEEEKLVPVWHHPNKGIIPVHKEEVDKPVVIWGEPLRYRKDNFIKESELGDFIDWIRDIDFKKYSEGWCQAGGSNGWHCSTEELLKAYREGFYPNNQSKEEAGEEGNAK